MTKFVTGQPNNGNSKLWGNGNSIINNSINIQAFANNFIKVSKKPEGRRHSIKNGFTNKYQAKAKK
jgi:hypothetical protein